jgi:hypothetical protein
MFCYARQHSRADFVAVMKSKDIVRPACSLQNSVRSRLAFDSPTETQQRSQNPGSFRRRPIAHAARKTSAISRGSGSPFSSRSAMTRKARA